MSQETVKGAIRIADVARHAKVGAGTVSRVLNGSQNVAPETRDRVLATISKLGYVPNLVARGLAANRTGVIAAIIPVIGYSQHSEVIQGMTEVLHEHGTTVMIGSSGYSQDTEEKIVATFLARRPDGFYVTGTWHSQKTRKLLSASSIPVVEGSNLTDDPIDTVVGYSNFAAARELTMMLMMRGYQRIAHVTVKRDLNDRIGDRLVGYRAACSDRENTRPTLVIECENSFTGGADAVAWALESSDPIDALFFATDVMAVGGLLECQRRGIAVPTQLAIAGFDDLPIASSVIPTLTTVHVDRVGMGRKIADVLLQRINGEPSPSNRIDVGFQIRERNSTLKPEASIINA
ncbi:LacI family DNA-binding transcriptional regulator [Bradyrhizobium sp. U531]|uniref:LacI family DNA-binding transcriptional regulator n=1 Tax=Bradyrhizobium sp. U531 TaxID=3053458 RepID=UPI003F4364D1